MHKKLDEVFRRRELPIVREAAVEKLEKDFLPGARMTPLHGLYAEFVTTACGSEHCFNKGIYYVNRCMTPLCFARWLVLKGYAKFNFKELSESIGKGLVKEGYEK